MRGTFLAVQWLKLCASNAGGMGLILGQGTKIPCNMRPKPSLSKSEISIHIKYIRKFRVKRRKIVELAMPEFLSSPVQQLYRHKLPEVNILELEFILIPVLAAYKGQLD